MSAKVYKLADGVDGLFVKNERFNTTSVSFNFYLPLKKATAAEYALLPFILTTCGAEYPDFSRLNYKLNKLYGARLDATAEKMGDYQLLKMRISVIDDRFTFESESLLKQAINMLLSLVFLPKTENGAFCETDLAREKRKAIEHINGEKSEKRIYAKNRLIEEMYKDEAYGIPKCGTVEDVEKITGESLFAAWRDMLETAYVRIIIIGAALPARLFDDISHNFTDCKRHNITDCTNSKPTAFLSEPVTVTEKMPVQQGKLVMGFSAEMIGDDSVTLPLMVMTDIFGGGPYSRLFSNVREKMSLCYYCSASSVRIKGLLTVESGVESQNADKTEKAVIEQLDAVKKGEFSDFEFESSLKSIKDSLSTYNDSQNSLDAWYSVKAYNKELYSPEDIAEKLAEITRDDVIKAADGVKLHTVYKLLPQEGK
ncbi:MAG: insulinase family protein [Acutalibacteraceae bacterium]|nr:insulinase family protein [Acutalibacteraceae bacterium]